MDDETLKGLWLFISSHLVGGIEHDELPEGSEGKMTGHDFIWMISF